MTPPVFRHRTDDLQSRARLAGYAPEKLDAVVLVVGMGALGQNTAQNLVLTGIREVRIVDADCFEEHNRTRSPLFPSRGAVGTSKVESTARPLQRLSTNPAGRVRYAHAWIEDLGLAVFDDVDVVVSCVDTLRGRAYLADMCRALSLPLIEGGFHGPDVTLAVFPRAANEDEAATLVCWRCDTLVHDQAVSCRVRAAQAEAAGTVPAIQSAAAVLGGLQAEAVVETLHERAPEARRIWLDIRSGESLSARLTMADDCRGYHMLYPAATPIEASSTSTLSDVLACAPRELGEQPAVRLRSEWVEDATCATCDTHVTVEAPGHHYSRAPRCTDCGGSWRRRVSSTPVRNPVSVVRRDDRQASRTAADVGYGPGDLVQVEGAGQEAILRLQGSADDLLTDADS